MTARYARRAHYANRAAGFTMAELLIVVVITTVITGAIAMAFVTSISAARTTGQRVRESDDAQFISAYLVRDAQAAGGSDPATGVQDPTIGVSLNDPSYCADNSLVLVASFRWLDRAAGGSVVDRVANYYYDSARNQLLRRTCSSGSFDSAVILGRNVKNVGATCIASTACPDSPDPSPGLPDFVTLTVTETNIPHNTVLDYTFTLTASLRSQAQVTPVVTNSTPIALMTLNASSASCALSSGVQANGLRVNGSNVTVAGQVIVNTPDSSGACPAMRVGVAAGTAYSATATSIISPGGTCNGCSAPLPDTLPAAFPDPYASLPTPPAANQCSSTNTNPSIVGNNWPPGVYGDPAGLTVNQGKTLQSGTTASPVIFVFCHGVKFVGPSDDTGAPVPTLVHDAMLYLAAAFPGCATAGSMCYAGIPDFNFQSATTGTYTNIAVWQPSSNSTNLSIPGGDDQTNAIVGAVYAPAAIVNLDNGDGDLAGDNSAGLVDPIGLTISAIIAKTVSFNSGKVALGRFAIVTPNMPNGKVSTAYSLTMKAIGGILPYKSWTMTVAGSPPVANLGLSINASTGAITGTVCATCYGNWMVHITVDDSSVPPVSTFHDYVLKIAPATLAISTASLPNGSVGTSYSTTVVGAGGIVPYTWSASGLPAGLSINPATGVISGTPTATASPASVVITLTDSQGPPVSVSKTLNMTIKAQLAITTATLPDGMVGTAYSQTVSATGGNPAYTWTISGGALPNGLSINAGTGTISGTPTVAGVFSFVVRVTDSLGATTAQAYNVTIAPQPLTITGPASLPNGNRNKVYPSQTIVAAGGTTPYSWSISVGSLPTGLSLNAGTGVISGTPTVNGTYSFTVRVTDAAAATATKAYTIIINRVAATNVTLANGSGTTGKADIGDTIAVTYSTLLDDSTFCSAWSGTGNQTISSSNNVVVTITNNGSNDTLTVTSTSCTFHFGSVSLGGDYVSNTRTFSGSGASASTITWNSTTLTLTIKLGTASGSTNSGIALGTPSYTANASIQDTNGIAIDTTAVNGSPTSRF